MTRTLNGHEMRENIPNGVTERKQISNRKSNLSKNNLAIKKKKHLDQSVICGM